MNVDLWARVTRGSDGPAIITAESTVSHGDLASLALGYRATLEREGPPAGSVVSFAGDYSASSIGLFLALLKQHAITVPLSRDASVHADRYRDLAETEYLVDAEGAALTMTATGVHASHAHYRTLRDRGAPGLVLFSSGSTGTPKAIVQDMQRLLGRFRKPGKPQRMLIFLQLDHIGGINSLLYALANEGTLVIPRERSPDAVAAAVEQHRVELLPTSPTFLNLLLLSDALERYDLSSLRLITYGTEPMPESTLARLHEALPHAKLQQTYGLSEVGILHSRSRESGSLWMQVGGSGFDTRIRNGTLWVRAESAMLGYLNADAPFDDDGYFDTGDLVEQDGDWIRILGRASEIINVGGQKVYPAEVESALLEVPGVTDAVVFGEDNPITGKHVACRVRLAERETGAAFKSRMRRFLRDRLEPYKIPARVRLTDEALHNPRFKRLRRQPDGGQQA